MDVAINRQKKLDEFYQRRSNAAVSLETVNRSDVIEKINKLYGGRNWEPPVVVLCESPWQLMVLPVLVEILVEMQSDSARENLRRKLASPLWKRGLELLNEQLGPDGIEKLKKGRAERVARMLTQSAFWAVTKSGLPAQGKLWRGSAETMFEPRFSSIRNVNAIAVKQQVMRALIRKLSLFMEILPWLPRNHQLGGSETLGLEFGKLVESSFASVLLGRKDIFDILFSKLIERSCANDFNYLLVHAFRNIHIVPPLTDMEGIFGAYLDGIAGGDERIPRLAIEEELSRSVFAYSMFEKVCFICERPLSLSRDERGSLHSATGPAIAFRDGYSLFAWHGIAVDKDLILRPETITISKIESEMNAEVRRIMIDRYGADRYIVETGAEIIDIDDVAYLYRKMIPDDEPLVMVEVTNSTAEPDGTFKRYFLRVPPDTLSAREAVAWTFGMDLASYCPVMET